MNIYYNKQSVVFGGSRQPISLPGALLYLCPNLVSTEHQNCLKSLYLVH